MTEEQIIHKTLLGHSLEYNSFAQRFELRRLNSILKKFIVGAENIHPTLTDPSTAFAATRNQSSAPPTSQNSFSGRPFQLLSWWLSW